MSLHPKLRLDWCSHEAAKYACEKWHYSGCIPKSKLVKIGVWESGVFVGVVIFGYGATAKLGAPYRLGMTECCELVRVAMQKHKTPVSKILALALKLLRKQSQGIRLIISYADPSQGHHGGIYQATNWIYSGKSASTVCYKDPSGKLWHGRRASKTANPQKQLVTDEWKEVRQPGKHRYLMPLDDAMRRQIEPLRKPYPKRVTSADSGTPGIQPGGGGASPTVTLSIPASTPNGKTRTTARADNTEDSQRQPRKAAAKQARAKARK